MTYQDQPNPRNDEVLTLYVSGNGDNNWSGSLPEPNADGTDGPLKTIVAAQRAARRLKGKKPMAQDIHIVLRGGTYTLSKPLSLGRLDSGAVDLSASDRPRSSRHKNIYPTYRLMLRSAEGETARLSGGRPINNLEEVELDGRRAWRATLPRVKRGTWSFKSLRVGSRWARRPRLPKAGLYRIESLPDWDGQPMGFRDGQQRFVYRQGDVDPSWSNLQEVEVVVLHKWIESHLGIMSIDGQRRIVNLDQPSRMPMLDPAEPGRQQPTQYYLENVAEALAEPGEFYLDHATGVLTYLPHDDEQLGEVEVVAPVLDHVMDICGDGRGEVDLVTLQGLVFSDCAWDYPEGQVASRQAADDVPAAIRLTKARRIELVDCTVHAVDCWAVELTGDVHETTLVGCTLTDLGGGGVKLWQGCSRNTIERCEIGPCGRRFVSSVGVLIGDASGNIVRHNHVHHVNYTGISVGWTWGYADACAFGNLIEYNHIHHIAQGMLADLGGVYTLGPSQGTRIRGNIIHDVEARMYAGYGIYTDEGSTEVMIEGNLVYGVNFDCVHQHYGRDNRLEGNVLISTGRSAIWVSVREQHRSFDVRRNIIWLDGGDVLGGNWSGCHATFSGNLYWCDGQGKPTFDGKSFEQWKRFSDEDDAVLGDPKFRDAPRGDVTMKPGSAAKKIGFVPLELDRVGVEGK